MHSLNLLTRKCGLFICKLITSVGCYRFTVEITAAMFLGEFESVKVTLFAKEKCQVTLLPLSQDANLDFFPCPVM